MISDASSAFSVVGVGASETSFAAAAFFFFFVFFASSVHKVKIVGGIFVIINSDEVCDK